mmetsp:Transcript_30728/g.56156  ORF Transcript_30728/g.56156 Transcript_30728/m.56156 type:complete len:187 (+) Transcript_30728:48-608(+)
MGGTLGVTTCCCDEQQGDSFMEISAHVPNAKAKQLQVTADEADFGENTATRGLEEEENGVPRDNARTAPLAPPKLDLGKVQEADADSSTFAVEISRGNNKLGMNVAVFDLHGDIKGVTVKAIREGGTIAGWNQAHPDRLMCVGQQILKANDKDVTQMTVEELGRLFETSTVLRLLVKRELPEKAPA